MISRTFLVMIVIALTLVNAAKADNSNEALNCCCSVFTMVAVPEPVKVEYVFHNQTAVVQLWQIECVGNTFWCLCDHHAVPEVCWIRMVPGVSGEPNVYMNDPSGECAWYDASPLDPPDMVIEDFVCYDVTCNI